MKFVFLGQLPDHVSCGVMWTPNVLSGRMEFGQNRRSFCGGGLFKSQSCRSSHRGQELSYLIKVFGAVPMTFSYCWSRHGCFSGIWFS